MNIQSEIHSHNLQRRNHIYNSFSEAAQNKDFEKALSMEEFNKKYGSGYEVFHPDGIEKFEKALTDTGLEKGLSGDEISSQIKESKQGLEKVFVKNEGGRIAQLFVRKK